MFTRIPWLTVSLCLLFVAPALSHPGHHKKTTTLKLTKFRRAGLHHKRLAGNWKLSASLSKKLHTKFSLPKLRAISLTLDTAALNLIPERVRPMLQKNVLIVAGFMKAYLKKKAIPYKIPFVVTLFNGEVQLLFFLHRGKKKYSNPESFQISLMTSEDKKRDILFVGGDLGIESMGAFKRVAKLP